MNTQIERLFAQALDLAVPETWTTLTPEQLARFKDKFAELIVQECASRVDNILRERKDGGGTMGDEIREHFGVQE
jgi:hypothetical protein